VVDPDEVEMEQARRKTSFTPPRSITLDNRFDGAVNIDVWPGYAVQRVSKSGKREVVLGPKTIMLEYDETLQHMELSTGKPKTDNDLLKTVFLRVENNRVSDIVGAVSSDLVDIKVRVNYRLNFTGAPEKWFMVDNYVKFVTQHCRSMIRNVIKQKGIQEINANITDIIRDTILGTDKEGVRPGRVFAENGAKIYDVEVLDLAIGDEDIAEMLVEAQHSTVSDTLEITAAARRLEVTKALETAKRAREKEIHATKMAALKQQAEEIKELEASRMAALKAEEDRAALQNKITEAELATQQKVDTHETKVMDERTKIKIAAVTDQFKSIQPALIEALIASGNQALATELAKNLPKATSSDMSALGLGGLPALLHAVKGTPMEKALKDIGFGHGLTAEDGDERRPNA
jgi:major vault protein